MIHSYPRLFMKRQNTCSHLLTLAFTLCGLVVLRADAQQPAPNTPEFPTSGPPANAVAHTAKSNAPRPVPTLLELTEYVTSKNVKPRDVLHFRVIEDVIEDGLVVIAKATVVGATVERLDKHGGPEKAPVLLVRFGTVKTVTGEELPIASATGNQSGDLEKLTIRFEEWPGVRVFFGPAIHYLPPGTPKKVGVVLPSQLDHARLLAAQPKLETPGYATVYFLPPESSAPPDVWCGAVEIGIGFKKVLLRPGNYSCRVERYSVQESYLDFYVTDGGTYYLVADGDSSNGGSATLSLVTRARVFERWNQRIYDSPASGKVADLTKVDPGMFRKLPPFVCAGQLQCGSPLDRALAMYALGMPSARAQQSTPDAQASPPGSAASSVDTTAEPNGPRTTPMVLELSEEVTSKKAKPDDELHFHVVEDVVEDGLVVIAKGTAVRGKVERVDKRGGWMKDGGLIVRTGPVRAVTGEDLPIAGTLGQKGGKRDVKGGLAVSLDPAAGAPLTTPIILPFLPFIKGDDYVLPSGTRGRVQVALPAHLDRARLRAAQPSPERLPGYATVYVLTDVWCGAVEIGIGLSKVLLRPGNYSCRVETFSAQESYVESALADGGTYYVVVDCVGNCVTPDDIRPSFTTAAGAVDMWNSWMQTHPSGKTEDLTKVDPEAFRKLPPFLRVEQ